MFTISDKIRDVLHVINAIIWLLLAICAWTANATYVTVALYLMTFLMTFYFIMGATKGDKLKIGVPFLYPILSIFVVWCLAFAIAVSTRGQVMGLILGMHPGMFADVIIFWVGSLLTGTLSYALFFKESVSDQDWENFMKEVAKIKK